MNEEMTKPMTWDCTVDTGHFTYGNYSMLDAIHDWWRLVARLKDRNQADPPANEAAFTAMRYAEVEALEDAVKKFGIDVWDKGLCELHKNSETRGMRSDDFVVDDLMVYGKKTGGTCCMLSYSIAGRTMITFDVKDGDESLILFSLVCQTGGKGEKSGSQSLYGTARNAIHVLGFVARRWADGLIVMREDKKVGMV